MNSNEVRHRFLIIEAINYWNTLEGKNDELTVLLGIFLLIPDTFLEDAFQ